MSPVSARCSPRLPSCSRWPGTISASTAESRRSCPGWVKGPGVNTITFGELLTHRAGFRLNSGLVFTTDNAARDQVRHGIDQVDKQVADYNNINFTIFRDLLPFMAGVRDPGPAARAAAADRFFIAYVQ